jgi:hypothetical protein
MKLKEVVAGMRVDIAPNTKGKKSRCHIGTIQEQKQTSHIYWKDYVSVLRDGYTFPQMIHCSRLTPRAELDWQI